ncbi:DUF3304 domain-containing protein [Franzmannia pantelleriensis]|uniref:DUF3304 domain-containing protein n=1 Tax=Franzmannia pantelleriensis TaxID=48727 RepID=UPI000B7FCFF0|nr:DUF3304 domain-containing protein [Halomonas pantelleriensis]
MLVRWIWNWLFNQIWYGLPKGARWGLGALFVGYFVWLFFLPNLNPSSTSASIIGHNHMERRIHSFRVNEAAGGDLGPNSGGGSIVCCQRVGGKTAEVTWTYSRTVAEFERGDNPISRTVTLPMPERGRHEQYLHVHILSDDEVKLGWSQDLDSPYAEIPYASAKGEAQ